MANPRLADLIARGLAQAAARSDTQASDSPPPDASGGDASTRPAAGRYLRLVAPQRVIVETNLARKGLWAVAPRGADEQLALALFSEDRLGAIRRIDRGPSLGPLEMEVAVWLCSRYREEGDPLTRKVTLTLSGLAADFGWKRGGHNYSKLAGALRSLTVATFELQVFHARTGAPARLGNFSLLDRWEASIPDGRGKVGEPGFVVIGDWLAEQLRARHLTYLNWTELRALDRPIAKRLLLFLEAERFDQPTKAWRIDTTLLTTLGMGHGNPRDGRARLKAAGEAITLVVQRYRRVSVDGRRGDWRLIAERSNGGRRSAD